MALGISTAQPLSGAIFECAAFGCGTVFKLSQQASGGWLETVLDTFNGADGAAPLGTLILDGAGNLYGTTSGDAGGTTKSSSGACSKAAVLL